jgi:hypothetical protein
MEKSPDDCVYIYLSGLNLVCQAASDMSYFKICIAHRDPGY